jgi:hypothetical protein
VREVKTSGYIAVAVIREDWFSGLVGSAGARWSSEVRRGVVRECFSGERALALYPYPLPTCYDLHSTYAIEASHPLSLLNEAVRGTEARCTPPEKDNPSKVRAGDLPI